MLIHKFFSFIRLHSIILVVESGLFGLFVTAIMCDQMQAIFGDETAVEQVKQQVSTSEMGNAIIAKLNNKI